MTAKSVKHSHKTQLAELTRINTHDLLKAFGLEKVRCGRQLLDALVWWPARRFAQTVLHYDQLIGEANLSTGGAWAAQALGAQIKISNVEHVPAQGPLLILANHPGLTDTVALFAAIPRPDLRILAAERPFLNALPQTSRYLISINEASGHNLTAIRAAAGHLRSGGALLTFPAGQIEPDPAVLPGALASLQHWSASIALFARLAPATQIVPVLVSGVLSARAQRSPLRLIRRQQKDREWLAATLQLIWPAYRSVTVQVTFGRPILAADFSHPKHDSLLMRAIVHTMQTLIKRCQSA